MFLLELNLGVFHLPVCIKTRTKTKKKRGAAQCELTKRDQSFGGRLKRGYRIFQLEPPTCQAITEPEQRAITQKAKVIGNFDFESNEIIFAKITRNTSRKYDSATTHNRTYRTSIEFTL